MRLSKKVAAIAVTAGIALTATAAFAYWTSQGGGSGNAVVGDVVDVTLNPVNITGTLYPGGPDASVSFTINNGQATTVKTGQVVVDTGVANVWPNGLSGLPAGCLAADFTFSSAATSHTVAGNGSTVGSGSLTMADTAANQDACQTATPTLHLKALPGV